MKTLTQVLLESAIKGLLALIALVIVVGVSSSLFPKEAAGTGRLMWDGGKAGVELLQGNNPFEAPTPSTTNPWR